MARDNHFTRSWGLCFCTVFFSQAPFKWSFNQIYFYYPLYLEVNGKPHWVKETYKEALITLSLTESVDFITHRTSLRTFLIKKENLTATMVQ